MNRLLTPRGFLQVGGTILLVLGIVGYVLGVVFPQGKFLAAVGIGNALWLDNFENVAHTVLGIVAIAAAYSLTPNLQKWLVVLVGAFGIVVTILGLVYVGAAEPNMGITNLEFLDDVIHFAVGTWGLVAALRPTPMMQTAH